MGYHMNLIRSLMLFILYLPRTPPITFFPNPDKHKNFLTDFVFELPAISSQAAFFMHKTSRYMAIAKKMIRHHNLSRVFTICLVKFVDLRSERSKDSTRISL